MWCPNDTTMADYSHILFNKTPEQMRMLGRRGGRASARKQRRLRTATINTPGAAQRVSSLLCQTTADAIATLDAQFPWLRFDPRQPARKPSARASRTVHHD